MSQQANNGSQRILLIDDDPVIRRFYPKILAREGYDISAYAGVDEFLAALPPEGGACLILDIELSDRMNGVELYHEIVNARRRFAVIFVSAHATVSIAVDVVRSGALNVLTKGEIAKNPERLLQAVADAMLAAEEFKKENLLAAHATACCAKLTGREKETLRWIITGRLNKQIAAELGISERTVKAHRAKVMYKLEVTSAVEAARIALLANLVPIHE